MMSTGSQQIELPRLIYLGRMVQLCFFPVLTVVLGVVLLLLPQAGEAMVAFADDPLGISQKIFFEVSFLCWMLSAWYVARLLVGRRFHPDLVGKCRSPGFAHAVAKWLPRSLALFAGAPVAAWVSLHALGVGLMLWISWLLVLAGIVFRRPVAIRTGQRWVHAWKQRPDEQFERFEAIHSLGWCFIAALFVLSAGLWIALPAAMEHIARPVGTPALLLFALMSWTIFGGFVLTYMPKSYGKPALTWVPLLLALIFYPFNEGHVVRAPGGNQGQAAQLPALHHEFQIWLKKRRNHTAPVIFVATAGGAARAAFWTSSALGMLEDDAHKDHKVFADNLFVISGISGGSLGAAAFVASLDQVRHENPAGLPNPDNPCTSVRTLGEEFTGRDDLSTVFGLMLYPDLLDRFLPFSLPSWDRSRGLEEVWTRDWWTLIRDKCMYQGSNPWGEEFRRLHARGGDRPLPALALSSTALGSGQPVLQADFLLLGRSDIFDLNQLSDPRLPTGLAIGPITLAQAVHNSARFPYVSPAGVIKRRHGGLVWDRLGDGGYVETSGTQMLVNIIAELRQGEDPLIRDPRDADAKGVANGEYIEMSQVRVLVLDNTPTAAPAAPADGNPALAPAAVSGWLCWRDASSGKSSRIPQNQLSLPPKTWPDWLLALWVPPVPDLTAPGQGSFQTRTGRNVSAQQDLLNLAGGCTEHFAELRLPKPLPGGVSPSMNWMLSKESRCKMHDELLHEHARDSDSSRLLHANLRIVRSWLVAASSPAAAPPAAPDTAQTVTDRRR